MGSIPTEILTLTLGLLFGIWLGEATERFIRGKKLDAIADELYKQILPALKSIVHDKDVPVTSWAYPMDHEYVWDPVRSEPDKGYCKICGNPETECHEQVLAYRKRRAKSGIDTTNLFAVSIHDDEIILLNPPRSPMSKDTALNLAAYLVALADHGDIPFRRILEAVQNA